MVPVPKVGEGTVAVVVGLLLITAVPVTNASASVSAQDGQVPAAADAGQTIRGVSPDWTTGVTGVESTTRSDDGPPESPPNATQANASASVPDRPEAESLGTVTLISGHEIHVTRRGDRRVYEVESNGTLYRYDTPRGTYFFPEDVDLDRFHPSLFNVDLLLNQSLGTDGDPVPVLVRFRRGTVRSPGDGGTTPGIEAIQRLGLSAHRTVEPVDVVSTRVATDRTKSVYESLGSAGSVERVYPDLKVSVGRPYSPNGTSHDDGPQQTTKLGEVSDYIAADEARSEHSVTGNNVTVAVIDSGVDETHPAIAGDEILEKSFGRAGNNTNDTVGHGTHVAGIITAEGGNLSYRGVAPDATILDLSIGRQRAFTSTVLDAMEYADRKDADVVSMSLGLPQTRPRSDSVLTDMIGQLSRNGTLVVVSAGNSGSDYTSISSPGIQKGVLTVGATGVGGSTVTDFSSRGPTQYERGVKPDLVAPGSQVVSTATDNGYIFEKQGWGPLSGTSMSAPATSGAAALLLEAHPTMTPGELKARLVGTADRFDGPDVYTQGGGQVNVDDAIESSLTVSPATLDFGSVSRDGPVTKTVTVHNDGETAKTVSVSATVSNVRGGTDAEDAVSTSTSEITVPAGGSASFEVSVDATASPSGTFSGRLRVGDQSTSFGWTHPSVVTVKKAPRSGQAVDEDTIGFVGSRLESGTQFATVDDEDEVATFTTTRSSVLVFSVGESEGSSGRSIHTAKTVEIHGDTTIVLDENDTALFEYDPSRIEAEVGELIALQQRTALTNFRFGYGTGTEVVTTADPPSSVRFSRTNYAWEASMARLAIPQSDLRTTDDGVALENGSDVFGPLVSISGVEGDRTVRPDPDEMGSGRLQVPYLGDDQRHAVSLSLEGVNATSEFELEGTTPSLQVHGRNYDVVITGTDTETGATWSDNVIYIPNTDDTIRIHGQPLIGQAGWRSTANGFLAEAALQVPQGGSGWDFHESQEGYARLTVGNESLEATPDDGIFRGRLNVSSLDVGTPITLRTRGVNTAHEYSTQTNTTYEATYNREDSRPPSVEAVSFPRLRPRNNSIPEWGGTVLVTVSDYGSGISGVTAYVSDGGQPRPFETGGDGWSEATVTEVAYDSHTANTYRIEFDASQFSGEFFDLAVRVEDERNNSVRTVVRNAMRVVDRGTAGPLVRADVDGDGTISDGELQRAIRMWVQGDLTDQDLQRIINAWVTGEVPRLDR